MIRHILSVIHYKIRGAACFRFTHCLVIERIYILYLIIIIKSEVWTITHFLGLGHETTLCVVCRSVFVFWIGTTRKKYLTFPPLGHSSIFLICALYSLHICSRTADVNAICYLHFIYNMSHKNICKFLFILFWLFRQLLRNWCAIKKMVWTTCTVLVVNVAAAMLQICPRGHELVLYA